MNNTNVKNRIAAIDEICNRNSIDVIICAAPCKVDWQDWHSLDPDAYPLDRSIWKNLNRETIQGLRLLGHTVVTQEIGYRRYLQWARSRKLDPRESTNRAKYAQYRYLKRTIR